MKSSRLKVLVVILSAGIVVVSGLYIDLFYQLKEQRIGRARDSLGLPPGVDLRPEWGRRSTFTENTHGSP